MKKKLLRCLLKLPGDVNCFPYAAILACVAGVRRERKEERRAREAREDRTREDRGRGRLQGRHCFLYSAL